MKSSRQGKLVFEYVKNPLGSQIVITGRKRILKVGGGKFFFAKNFTVDMNNPDFLALARRGIEDVQREYDEYVEGQGKGVFLKMQYLDLLIKTVNKGKRL